MWIAPGVVVYETSVKVGSQTGVVGVRVGLASQNVNVVEWVAHTRKVAPCDWLAKP